MAKTQEQELILCDTNSLPHLRSRATSWVDARVRSMGNQDRLALYAAIYCDWKRTWIPIAALLIVLLLALGVHTPLYQVLYEFVPGFNKFRSVSKFIFTASLFLALLAAMGFDRLLRRKNAETQFVLAVFVVAASLAGAASWALPASS